MGKRCRSRVAKRKRAEMQSTFTKTVQSSFFSQQHDETAASSCHPIPGPLSTDDFNFVNNRSDANEKLHSTDDATSSPDCLSPNQWESLKSIWSVIWSRNERITKPSPVQLYTWPVLLSNAFNLIQLAPTGSGKTFAYGVPLVQFLRQQQQPESSLVLVPTRELAIQVGNDLRSFMTTTKNEKESIIIIHGGVNKHEQRQSILSATKGFIISATMGRLLDLCKDEGNGDKGETNNQILERIRLVKHVVLDEADRLAMNTDLCQQVNSILEICYKSRETMSLCSATCPASIKSQWKEWVTGKPCVFVEVDTTSRNSGSAGDQATATSRGEIESCHQPVDANQADEEEQDEEDKERKHAKRVVDFAMIPSNLTQTLHVCAEHKKPKKLMTTIRRIRKEDGRQPSLGIVFVGKIKKLHYVHALLKKEKVNCVCLHGQLQQTDRERAVASFKCGKLPLLVATDVAARGIHVSNVAFVINYDFPGNLEQYIHRCGRAGRNGSEATVFSFFTRNLSPLAPDVVEVLEATNQEVDPNLRELAASPDTGTAG